ncbi:MAG: protein kinase [Deltaproteobacteria bacterium]|nr:protein kinase [Deltaproteobacteria bacterium]
MADPTDQNHPGLLSLAGEQGKSITVDSGERYSSESGASAESLTLDEADELGRGALGRVVELFDNNLGRKVALKYLSIDSDSPLDSASRMSGTSETIARFLREAKVTAQLEHPNIVPVHDLGIRKDGTLFYTMKMVKGRTFSEVLKSCKTLGERLVYLDHFIDLCNAVAYAHDRGVIHRDIKPANVMVGEFGETMLLDWGVAKVKGEKDLRGVKLSRDITSMEGMDATGTVDGTTIGTPAYMSPEQARGLVDKVDERSDVWSLGAVLYELLTGLRPFSGNSPSEVLEKVRKGRIIPVNHIVPEAPEELAAIAHKALQRERNKRYASAGGLARDVQAFQQGARVMAYHYSKPEIIKRFAGRHKVLMLSSGAALVSLLLAIVFITIAYKSEAEANREANFHIAEALNEKASTLSREKRFLDAAVFASAALLRNPANAVGPYFSRRFIHRRPESMKLLAEAAFWEMESKTRPVEGFQTSFDTVYSPSTGSFSPDGRLFAAGSYDGKLLLFDTEKMDGLHKAEALDEPSGVIWAVRFSPDGKYIATGSSTGRVVLWDARKKKIARELVKKSKRIWNLAFSNDGRILAAACDDGFVRAWKISDGSEVLNENFSSVPIYDVIFLHNGKILISAGRDRTIRFWDMASGKVDASLKGPKGSIWSVDVSRDQKLLAVACGDGSVWVFDIGSMKPAWHFKKHKDIVFGVRFSSDGRFLVSAGMDRKVGIWQAETGSLLQVIAGHNGSVWGAYFSPDVSRLATVSEDKSVKIWRVKHGRDKTVFTGFKDQVWGLDFTPDGKKIVGAGFDGTVRIWDVYTGKVEHVLRVSEKMLTCIAVSPDGRHAATSGFDRLTHLIDIKNGTVTASLKGHDETVFWVEYSSDGRYLVTSDLSGKIILRDAETGRILNTMERKGVRVWQVDFTPDSKRLVISGSDDKAVMWGIKEDRVLKEFKGHTDWVSGVAVSRDGKYLATSGRDRTIILWDFKKGTILRRLKGHRQWVNNLEFSPDGKELLSTSDDGRVILWDVLTGWPLLVVRARMNVIAARFSPDGERFAIGDKNDVRLYPTTPMQLYENPEKLLQEDQKNAGVELDGFKLKIK